MMKLQGCNSESHVQVKSCRARGHDVTAVQTGKEGIEALDTLRPEMMIVDLFVRGHEWTHSINLSSDAVKRNIHPPRSSFYPFFATNHL
mmetsp:Transcript_15729/g.34049  ORF Transcript_15729/g.34049 Transcript_15729/m.34049 type:complete len:89 (+) Transcript_15729:289-555(+)